MTAANVTNNHTGPLRIGGVEIRAGATARVENWQNVESSKTVAGWIEAGILNVEEAKAAPAGFPPAPGGAPAAFPPAAKPGFGGKDHSNDPQGAEKDALIAELKKLTGVEKTRASSLESLQKQVDKAKASDDE